ncbi:MAG TPA: acyl-CoA dehydrogenase family protein [Acidimicrobiia bacterium]|nr:acyl-CoA dehydrogenase family protein [Acidimicrobiia bacterium]
MSGAGVDLERFREGARRWLDGQAERRPAPTGPETRRWGDGSDSVAVFPTADPAEERARAGAASEWQRRKFDAGYGAITWPPEFGGAGLTPAHERVFTAEERHFRTPEPSELFAVTIGLVAPTIAAHGTADQQRRFIRALLRTDLLACQLFSEPAAGSDLASVSCRAERDGDGWVLNGQKVWSSGAGLAHYGEAICRTDPALPRHRGLTAFLVPLDAGGVEVRPIRQMTGGASFNEVFLTDVRIPDDLRLGAVGDGWRVALTTLGFERSGGSRHGSPGGSFGQLVALARNLGVTGDPVVRQELARVFSAGRILAFLDARVRGAARAGQPPGPEGSIRKLAWTANLTRTGELAAAMLGPAVTADTGRWGTFAWTEHLLGAPGYRIAGGSDEIQRTIIAERVLGLPKGP